MPTQWLHSYKNLSSNLSSENNSCVIYLAVEIDKMCLENLVQHHFVEWCQCGGINFSNKSQMSKCPHPCPFITIGISFGLSMLTIIKLAETMAGQPMWDIFHGELWMAETVWLSYCVEK